jgi:hypothetical protein
MGIAEVNEIFFYLYTLAGIATAAVLLFMIWILRKYKEKK